VRVRECVPAATPEQRTMRGAPTMLCVRSMLCVRVRAPARDPAANVQNNACSDEIRAAISDARAISLEWSGMLPEMQELGIFAGSKP
jgi:hypothetical protein